MQPKTFALFALSAAAVSASPFHKRQGVQHHHHHHGTGTEGVRPTGSGMPSTRVNDTNGFFAPSSSASILPISSVITMTVSPLPEEPGSASTPTGFGNTASGADASTSSSCVSTSIVTEFSTHAVTVTASATGLNGKAADVNSVSPGAFYGGQSKSWGGGWGQSSSGAGVSVTTPSTTFATATKSGASGTASATASASASSTASSGSSSGKRGISYNDASLVSAFGGSVSWAYNWADSEGGSLGSVEYVPMCWGTSSVSGFASKVGSATHVLGFNEPDLAAQSNIDPQTAAQLHKEAMSGLVGKVQIGSPAVTNGNSASPPMGTQWLTDFFSACGTDCPVNFVAYHWYGGADAIDDFKSHTQAVIDTASKQGISKVWLTEFAPSGDSSAQATFMKQAVEFLESTSAVERYAAFMASDGTLLSGSTLNSVGSAYADAS